MVPFTVYSYVAVGTTEVNEKVRLMLAPTQADVAEGVTDAPISSG